MHKPEHKSNSITVLTFKLKEIIELELKMNVVIGHESEGRKIPNKEIGP